MTTELNVEEHLKQALAAHQEKNYEKARELYSDILIDNPENPDALHFMGLLLYQHGQPEDGGALIEKSLSINPNQPSAMNNLGNIYRHLGDDDAAMQGYWSAVQTDPAHVDSWSNMAVVYRNRNQPTMAEKVLTIASSFGPLDHRARHQLVLTYLDLREYGKAEDLARELIRDERYKGNIAILYANALDFLGRKEEALRVLLEWQKREPDNPVALHQVNAQRGVPSSGASENYVRAIFDDFAESFEGVLKGLEYDAPAFLAKSVNAHFGETRIPRAVDLGCGTGLLGDLLKPSVDHLTGVDLSPKMLLRARHKDVYDALAEAEIGTFLQAGDAESYDLVTAAEVLNYIGDLEPVYSAIAYALKPGGTFIGTYEILEDDSDLDHKLTFTGRYAHRETYVRAMGDQAGLIHVETTRIPLRKEFSYMVEGLVVTFAKPA